VYTLFVSDLSGNTANDSVIVTVLRADSMLTVTIVIILGVSTVVLLILEFRKNE
jgi:hypothetical protein